MAAKLLRGGRTVSDGIQFTGKIYRVSEEHRDWFGPELAVVAGPLKIILEAGRARRVHGRTVLTSLGTSSYESTERLAAAHHDTCRLASVKE